MTAEEQQNIVDMRSTLRGALVLIRYGRRFMTWRELDDGIDQLELVDRSLTEAATTWEIEKR